MQQKIVLKCHISCGWCACPSDSMTRTVKMKDGQIADIVDNDLVTTDGGMITEIMTYDRMHCLICGHHTARIEFSVMLADVPQYEEMSVPYDH